MKKLNLLSKTFIFIIFFVLVFVIVKTGLITLHVIDFYKGDNWKVVEKSNDPIYDKIMSLETNIENRINNYFPLYQNINSIYYNSIIDIDSLYLRDIYLKNNSDNEKIFYTPDNYYRYYIVNNYNSNELDKRLNNQLEFYNNLVNKYQDVNFYMYMPLRYEINSFTNINGIYNKYQEFRNKIDSRFKIDALEANDFEEYDRYFYKTDHHLNPVGAKKAYIDLLKLLEIDKDIDEEDLYVKDFYSLYYGSMAKSLLSKTIEDHFGAIIKPNYLEDGTLEVNIKDKKFKPLTFNYKENNDFYDYYVGYFDGQYDEVIYTNNNTKSNDNLLIISDSLAWQVDYLLASNYKNTYVVNLRYGKFKDGILDLESYLKDNNIKNVLFMQEAEVELFDIYNFNTARKVK